MSLTPLTRWEQFMAKIAGKAVSISPLTRREQFYDDIAAKTASVPAMEIEDPTDGQTLVYDATDDVWKNGAGGSGTGALVVNVTWNDGAATLDKTWQEIFDAAPNVIYKYTEDDYVSTMPFYSASKSGDVYCCKFYDLNDTTFVEYIASAADGYPEFTDSPPSD